MRNISWLLVLVMLPLSCQKKTTSPSGDLGDVSISFTSSQEAEQELLKGYLLLHSFEYEDARIAFRKVQEIDPYAPMAYWGEAMSHHYTLWDREETEEAQVALAKWAEIKPGDIEITAIEQDLLDAAAVLFRGGKQNERNQAYSDFMKGLFHKYPENHEIASIYALSLLGSVPEERDYAIFGKAASIANGILLENPRHPGALHYLIHAYDDPEHAHLAMKAADSYAQVAPDAAHALHMPSHIYVASGMWDKVVSSNFASYYASVDRMESKGMNNNARSYHAFAWLMYGLLHQNRMDEVDRIMADMIAFTDSTPGIPAKIYLTGMKGTYLAFTQDPNSPFLEGEFDLTELIPSTQTLQEFTKGYRAYLLGESQPVIEAIQAIKKIRMIGQNSVEEGNAASCSQPSAYRSPTLLDIKVAGVMQYELEALLADLQGDPTEVEVLFSQAIQLESETDVESGPPWVVKPAHELFGDWLLRQDRATDALEQFSLAEQRTPNRRLVLEGKYKAAIKLADPTLMETMKAQLDQFQQPDSTEVMYVSR